MPNDFTNKRVLIRVEYNVPLTSRGTIRDNSRITASLPTIKAILAQKPKQLIIMTHLGRPKSHETILQTDVLAKELGSLLNTKVAKVDHWGEFALPKDTIVMLENLRFNEGEKLGNKKFAKKLAKLADFYVNESFGTCHRKDASMFLVPKYFKKENRYIGLLLQDEISKLSEVFDSKDLTVLVGFAKIEDKLEIFDDLLKQSSRALIGGAVAFSFIKALGFDTGKSLASDDTVAKKLIETYNDIITLPTDFMGYTGNSKVVKKYNYKHMPKTFTGLDIGPASVEEFKRQLLSAKLVFWNGPLGKYEDKPFDDSTKEIAKFIKENKIKVIVGGGDTAAAIYKTPYAKAMYHISTGGGASLEFIKSGTLPALGPLIKASKIRVD